MVKNKILLFHFLINVHYFKVSDKLLLNFFLKYILNCFYIIKKNCQLFLRFHQYLSIFLIDFLFAIIFL